MNPERDLFPMLDPRADTPACVRTALSAGRADLPSAEALARLAGKLPLPGGGGPGGSGTPPHVPAAPTVPPVATPWLLPGLLGGAVAGVVTAAALVLWAPAASRAPTAPLDTASHALVQEAESVPAETVRAAPADVSPQGSVDVAGEGRAGVAGEGRSGVAGEGRAGVAGEGTPPNDVPGARGSASGGPSGTTRPSTSVPVPGAGTKKPTPVLVPPAEKESALLQRAREALSMSPAAALALADEHRSRYPGGMLAQERELIAVRALVALGRRADAKARAAAFVSAYPRSAHAPSVASIAAPPAE